MDSVVLPSNVLGGYTLKHPINIEYKKFGDGQLFIAKITLPTPVGDLSEITAAGTSLGYAFGSLGCIVADLYAFVHPADHEPRTFRYRAAGDLFKTAHKGLPVDEATKRLCDVLGSILGNSWPHEAPIHDNPLLGRRY